MAGLHRLSDFEKAVSTERYYIDRTPYIEKYEKADQPFVICLRPSGFDKMLLLSMLRFYYSKDLSKTSHKLFEKLYISTHKTPLYGSFTVFYLDFNSIITQQKQSIASTYYSEIAVAIDEYLISQKLPLKFDSKADPVLDLRSFLNQHGNRELFILINEYDYFHYEILDPDLNRLEEVKTSKNHLIRNIYSEFNQAINCGQIGRIFVAGIDDSQDR